MIYLTGDTHKDIDIGKLFTKEFQAKKLTQKDYLIILGDFGLPFLPTDALTGALGNSREQKSREVYLSIMSKLSKFPFTILFIDGNHDNHPFWYSQPIIEKFSGKVHPHPEASNVFHLMRGEYYTIDGYSIFTMGGANSIDKAMRIKNYNWWKEEVPSREEMFYGLDKLASHNYQVDLILTHCMPQEFVYPILHQVHEINAATACLDRIYHNCDYKYWFCGHYHVNINTPVLKIQILYNDIVSLEDYKQYWE